MSLSFGVDDGYSFMPYINKRNQKIILPTICEGLLILDNLINKNDDFIKLFIAHHCLAIEDYNNSYSIIEQLSNKNYYNSNIVRLDNVVQNQIIFMSLHEIAHYLFSLNNSINNYYKSVVDDLLIELENTTHYLCYNNNGRNYYYEAINKYLEEANLSNDYYFDKNIFTIWPDVIKSIKQLGTRYKEELMADTFAIFNMYERFISNKKSSLSKSIYLGNCIISCISTILQFNVLNNVVLYNCTQDEQPKRIITFDLIRGMMCFCTISHAICQLFFKGDYTNPIYEMHSNKMTNQMAQIGLYRSHIKYKTIYEKCNEAKINNNDAKILPKIPFLRYCAQLKINTFINDLVRQTC